MQRLKIGLYFALWFVLSVGYSISNKKVNNLLGGCAFSVATSTVAVGSVFVSALWVTGLRSAPRVPLAALRTLLPIGLCHALGHLLGTYSVAAGTVSFTQIVKAANPVYVCVLSTILLRQAVSLRVWLSLIPIVGGVALATVKELSFVWAALIAASASDLSMAIRNVLSKKSMGVLTDVNGRYLSTADMFGLLTVISTLLSLPFAIAIDGHALPKLWSAAAATTAGWKRRPRGARRPCGPALLPLQRSGYEGAEQRPPGHARRRQHSPPRRPHCREYGRVWHAHEPVGCRGQRLGYRRLVCVRDGQARGEGEGVVER